MIACFGPIGLSKLQRRGGPTRATKDALVKTVDQTNAQAKWAVNRLNPERFRRIADLERQFGTTIKKGQSVEEMARRGKEFVSDKHEELRRLALSPDAFTAKLFFLPEGDVWCQPAGAYRRCGGPS